MAFAISFKFGVSFEKPISAILGRMPFAPTEVICRPSFENHSLAILYQSTFEILFILVYV